MNIKLIFKLIFGLLLGLVLAVYLLQENDQFKQMVAMRGKIIFARAFKAIIAGQVSQVNLFSPTLILQNVVVVPIDQKNRGLSGSWSWSADHLQFSFSWFDLLFFRRGKLYVQTYRFNAHSSIVDNGKLAIGPHLYSLFISRNLLPIPLSLKSCVIQDGSFSCSLPAGQEVAINFSSTTQAIGPCLRTVMSLNNGKIAYSNKEYVRNCTGMVRFDWYNANHVVLEPNIRFVIPGLDASNNPCSLSGLWDTNQGAFSFKTVDGSCTIDSFHISREKSGLNCKTNGSCAIATLAQLLGIKLPTFLQSVVGMATFSCSGYPFNFEKELHGQIDLGAVTMDSATVDSLGFTFKRQFGLIDGAVTARMNQSQFDGNFFFNEARRSGQLTITNALPTCVPAYKWRIDTGKLCMRLNQDSSGQFSGSFSCTGEHEQTNEKTAFSGQFGMDLKQLYIFGTAYAHSFMLNMMRNPILGIKQGAIIDSAGNKVVIVKAADDTGQRIRAHVQYSFIKSLLPTFWQDELLGQGTFIFDGSMDQSGCSGLLRLHEGHMRLSTARNFINDLRAGMKYDAAAKKIIFHDTIINLHQGAISCKNAVIFHDDAGHAHFIHVPLVITDCQVGWDKDVHMLLTGALTYTLGASGGSGLSGSLIIQDGVIKKDNLQDVSALFNSVSTGMSRAYNQDTHVALHVTTRDPVKVITPSIEAELKLDLSLGKTLRAPEVTGAIQFGAGALLFPYKQLYIQKGQLHFAGGQLSEPILELVAKNRIKRYAIALHASGSLKNPEIVFESTPALSEEQILLLLFAGSENGSLNSAVPSFIVNGLASYFLHKTNEQSVLQKMFKPLDSVRIVPRIEDQVDGSGLSSILEIDVNDRLRALIAKDLARVNDAKFELEYLLTDDVTVKGVKDEGGDLGGEIEVRWKF